MRILAKSVALVLVLAALAWPAVALASCLQDDSDSVMNCPPDCPMMARHASVTRVQAQSAPTRNGSCCDISSGKPAPSAVPQLPSTSTNAEVVSLADSQAFLLPQQPQREISDSDSPPPDISVQAVLCTFLI